MKIRITTSSTKLLLSLVKILDFGAQNFKNFFLIYKIQNLNKYKHNGLHIRGLGEERTHKKLHRDTPIFGAFIANYIGKGITSFVIRKFWEFLQS